MTVSSWDVIGQLDIHWYIHVIKVQKYKHKKLSLWELWHSAYPLSYDPKLVMGSIDFLFEVLLMDLLQRSFYLWYKERLIILCYSASSYSSSFPHSGGFPIDHLVELSQLQILFSYQNKNTTSMKRKQHSQASFIKIQIPGPDSAQALKNYWILA